MEIIYSFNHYTESWVEVSSQPSSSSVSSAATDDIITTGLRVHHGSHARRRRRLNRSGPYPLGELVGTRSTAGSSQEEYDESESESERIMNSSNEGLGPPCSHGVSPPAPTSTTSEEISSEGDDDENSTALGIDHQEPAFTPQPNAFSHPPRSSGARQIPPAEVRSSYFPASRGALPRPAAHSYPDQRPRSHTPYNVISPSHQVDHDAALRASLSTLLSCAAAARGLPKRDQRLQSASRPINRPDPVTLRVVSESAISGEEATGRRAAARRSSVTSSSAQSLNDKGKRKASTSKERREMRKKRRGSAEEMTVTPTLMTWVVSAGVVVLFSVISFSAGYAIGREVGRMEAGVNSGPGGVMGGKEVGKSLRRLRWGSTSTVVRV
ncbi:hypothetical protein MMC07_001511 [Pseudocyphellaria aurata]|nr:hypothetical protein [Pseudocyphellaria aurata]